MSYLDTSKNSLAEWLDNRIRNINLDYPCPERVPINEYQNHDSPMLFLELSQEEQMQLFAWCYSSLDKVGSINYQHTSYGMKHIFERSPLGFYVSNGQFIGAMLVAGFKHGYIHGRNMNFNVSEKSIKAVVGKQIDFSLNRMAFI
jgi:hypothetical protein